jgi:GTPase SAR1 family protein
MHHAQKRVLLVGKEGVGKDALKSRYVAGIYNDEPAEYVNDSMLKTIEIDGNHVVVEIFDVDLTDEGALPTFYHERMVKDWSLVGVYGVDDRTSLAALQHFFAGPRKAPVKLIATKCDRHSSRQVTVEEGEKVAASLGCEVVEVSAKENVQVDEAFAAVACVVPDFVHSSATKTKRRGAKCAIS